MNHKAHRIGGVCIGLSAGLLLKQDVTSCCILALAGGVGGLLPDVDEPQSYVGKLTWPISVLFKKFCGHRGFTHSPLGVALFYVLLFLAGKYLMTYTAFQFISVIVFIYGTIVFLPQLAPLWIWAAIYYFSQDLSFEVFYHWVTIGMTLGCISHLFLDIITTSGIPLFIPFNFNKVSILPLHTNKDEGFAYIISFILLGIAYLTSRNLI